MLTVRNTCPPCSFPAERPSAATKKKKKKYANLVRALVGGSGTLDDVLAARLGAAAGDPWQKEREQGRAYLQSQADFLAQAEARARAPLHARFGRARDSNLDAPILPREELLWPRKEYEGPAEATWKGFGRLADATGRERMPRLDDGGWKAGLGGRGEHTRNESEVVKRSVDEPRQFDDFPGERQGQSGGSRHV